MPRYTNDEVKQITQIQLAMVKNEMSYTEGEHSVLNIHSKFPVHNLQSYNNNLKKYLSGLGCYGPRSLPANWAKALLEATNNNSMIIQALNHQQELYLQNTGRNNRRLNHILQNLPDKVV